jgi:hypothetical protein
MNHKKKSIKAFRYVIYVIKITLRSLHFNITLIQLFINTLTFQPMMMMMMMLTVMQWWVLYFYSWGLYRKKISPEGKGATSAVVRQIEWTSGLPLIAIHMHNYIPLPILSRWIFYEMKLCTWSTEMNFMALITIYCFHFHLLLLYDGTGQSIFSRSWWWW